MLATSPCYKHLQAAVKVHQALSSLHGDLGGFVYLDFDQQGLWFVIGLGHLQSPRHILKASPWTSAQGCLRELLVSAARSSVCKGPAVPLRKGKRQNTTF